MEMNAISSDVHSLGQLLDGRYVAVLVEHLGALVAAHELATVHAHRAPVLVGVPAARATRTRTRTCTRARARDHSHCAELSCTQIQVVSKLLAVSMSVGRKDMSHFFYNDSHIRIHDPTIGNRNLSYLSRPLVRRTTEVVHTSGVVR